MTTPRHPQALAVSSATALRTRPPMHVALSLAALSPATLSPATLSLAALSLAAAAAITTAGVAFGAVSGVTPDRAQPAQVLNQNLVLNQNQALSQDQAPVAYHLATDDWEGPVGEEGYLVVTVVAREGFKINEKYPQRLTLEAPPKGLTLPLRHLDREHAQREGDRRLTFTIPVTADATGHYAVAGTLRLSVCSPNQCLVERAAVSARVVAQ